MTRLSRTEVLGLAACLLVFLFFGAAWIHLPGPQHDEMLPVSVLVPWLWGEAEFSIQLGNRHIVLMVMSYIGALKGWLLALWFLVVPTGVPGYRAFALAAGVVAVWLTFWFARRFWGRAVALLTTALVASDASFVQTIRLDWGPVALMHLFKMSGLCLLVRWLATGSRRLLTAGMFLFGLGLWDKATFIWFLAGLGATVLILFPQETRPRLREPGAVSVAAVAFLMGASPFLYYNLAKPGRLWRERGQFELRWFKLIETVTTFEGRFVAELTGEDQLELSPPAHDVALPQLARWMYRLGSCRRAILLPLLAFAVLLLPLNLWIAGAGGWRRLLFPLLLSLMTYACMFVSREGGGSVHHVIMLQPFLTLFVAVSLWTPVERWPGLVPRMAAASIVAVVIAINLSVNARHLAIYTRTGGSQGFTDAVYRLVPFLAQYPGRKFHALDWGLSNPVLFLGQRWKLDIGDSLAYDLFEPQGPRYARAALRLEGLMRDPNNIFLLHSPQRTYFPAPARLFFQLANAGIEMRQIAFFQERSGEMVYEVYQRGPPDPQRTSVVPPVAVRFIPDRARPGEEYVVEVKELANSWIDVVYHVDQIASGTLQRYCRLDAEGRARVTVPLGHPAATIRIVMIRPSGGEWRPAQGAITVVKQE